MQQQQSQRNEDPSPATSDVLCVVTAGPIRVGSGIKFSRARGRGGWVTARSIDAQRRWLNCVDNRGILRAVRLSEIYWVGNPPKPQEIRDLITPKRRRGRR